MNAQVDWSPPGLLEKPMLNLKPRSFLLAFLALLSGCGPTMPQLRATAAKDLDCPVSSIEIGTAKGKNTYYASCYGADATYHSTCEGELGCRWVRNPEPVMSEAPKSKGKK